MDFLAFVGHIAINLMVNFAFLGVLDKMDLDDGTTKTVSFLSGQAALLTVILIWSLFG